jgi:hypothetical protein
LLQVPAASAKLIGESDLNEAKESPDRAGEQAIEDDRADVARLVLEEKVYELVHDLLGRGWQGGKDEHQEETGQDELD